LIFLASDVACILAEQLVLVKKLNIGTVGFFKIMKQKIIPALALQEGIRPVLHHARGHAMVMLTNRS
jgi:hypothetical protein